MEHEKNEDVVLKKVNKIVKHGLAMHDLTTAMNCLKDIDALIKRMDELQSKEEKAEKKEEK